MIFFKNDFTFSQNKICCLFFLLLSLVSSLTAMEKEEEPFAISRSNPESLSLMNIMRNAAFRSIIQYPNEQESSSNRKNLSRALGVQPYNLEDEEDELENLYFSSSKNQDPGYSSTFQPQKRLWSGRAPLELLDSMMKICKSLERKLNFQLEEEKKENSNSFDEEGNNSSEE